MGQAIYSSFRSQVIKPGCSPAMTSFQETLGTTVNNLISIIGLLAVLTLLFYHLQTRFVKAFLVAGRWLMMVTFGVGFGNVVSGRLSVLLGELLKIFQDWLGLIPDYWGQFSCFHASFKRVSKRKEFDWYRHTPCTKSC